MPIIPVETDEGPPVARDADEITLEDKVRAEGRPYVRYRDGGIFRALSLSPAASPVEIGRSESCPVTLESDVLVSRHHARLRFAAGWWSVEDAGSSNGTFVGHRQIPGETILKDGACFRVGSSVLSIHLPESGPDETAVEEPATALLQPDDTQRKILVLLARPWLAGYAFPIAPSDLEIAHTLELDVTEIAAAVAALYEQAGLATDVDQRSGLIALAMHERTVTPDDLVIAQHLTTHGGYDPSSAASAT